jgi:hypothetical protein
VIVDFVATGEAELRERDYEATWASAYPQAVMCDETRGVDGAVLCTT